jgi:hypothetical protein
VDRSGGDAAAFEDAGDLVSAALGAREDEDAGEFRLGEQFGEQAALAAGFDEHDLLVDALDCGRGRRHRDFQRVVEQVARQLFDVRRHGGREEQVLTLARQMAHDAADRIDEAHVEHLVGLVEDEDFDLGEVSVLSCR